MIKNILLKHNNFLLKIKYKDSSDSETSMGSKTASV